MIIDDTTNNSDIFTSQYARGYVERDYSLYPEEMFDPPSQMQLIPEQEWKERIEEQERTQSSLEHIRMRYIDARPIPSLDQNGQGYCWAYSTTMATMLTRARHNLPYVRLSAHAIGCKVKNFRDEGGWCGLSAKFLREHGVPSVARWPEKSMDRQHDNEATWSEAKLYRTTEDWVDLTRSVYDQNLTFAQVVTCLLNNIPVALDYNWWQHSVCGIRAVNVAGEIGIRIINSWSDNWGENGMATLRGGRKIPNGAVAIRVTQG